MSNKMKVFTICWNETKGTKPLIEHPVLETGWLAAMTE
jgi:hypothetical protein